MRNRKILLISEAANPEWVSVPLVGWSLSQAIAEREDVHIVTQIRNRDAFIRAGLVEGVDFTAIDSEAIAAQIHKLSGLLRGGAGKGWTTTTAFAAISYYYFEHLVWKRFADDLRSGVYQIVHRITPLSPTTPSLIAKRCYKVGVPFILGPLNGGLPWPHGFNHARHKEKEWLSYIRSAYKLLPAYRSTRKYASAIIVASEATYSQMQKHLHSKCVFIPENAISPEKFHRFVDRPIERPIRLSFLGRLVPYKGCDMLLEAAAPLIRQGKITLDIIGDGPERHHLEKIIQKQGITNGTNILGWIAHDQVQNALVKTDVFSFPSVREFGGGVVLEAMAVGLLPIVLNYGGPGELVTDTTGYRISIGQRDQIIEHFHGVLHKLTQNPSIIRPMGASARKRVLTHFTWSAKSEQISSVYDWVLGKSSTKPVFEALSAGILPEN